MGKQETKNKILDGAFECFSNKPFHEVKIAEIAQVAGVGKGTVYEYFSSKEDLYQELFTYITSHYAEEMLKILSFQYSLKETLILLYKKHIELHGDMLKRAEGILIIEEMMTFKGKNRKEYMDKDHEIITVLKDLIIRGQKNGELPEDLDIEFAMLMIASALPALTHYSVVKKDVDSYTTSKKYVELIMNGIGKNS